MYISTKLNKLFGGGNHITKKSVLNKPRATNKIFLLLPLANNKKCISKEWISRGLLNEVVLLH